MIDKQEFYHGVAVVRLLEDGRCQKVRGHDFGYIVNDEAFIFPKYSTKSRSPWTFSFSRDEIERVNLLATSFKAIILALICGGDGICAISWRETESILGNNPGWISVRRKFNEQYGVAGPRGTLRKKVSLRQYPSIVFADR